MNLRQKNTGTRSKSLLPNPKHIVYAILIPFLLTVLLFNPTPQAQSSPAVFAASSTTLQPNQAEEVSGKQAKEPGILEKVWSFFKSFWDSIWHFISSPFKAAVPQTSQSPPLSEEQATEVNTEKVDISTLSQRMDSLEVSLENTGLGGWEFWGEHSG